MSTPSTARRSLVPPTPHPRRSLVGKAVVAARYLVRATRELIQTVRHRPQYPASPLEYDSYWEAREPVPIGRRFELFADLVRPGSKVLDVGCGEGTFLHYVRDRKGAVGQGVDSSEVAARIARERGLEVDVRDVSQGELPEVEVDHVVCGEVLEHVPEPEKILMSAKGIARESIVVSVPNTGYYHDRIRLLSGRFPVQWFHHPAEHVRFFTVADFQDFAKDLGFKIRAVKPAAGFPVLMNVWPNLFAQQVVYELVPEATAANEEATKV